MARRSLLLWMLLGNTAFAHPMRAIFERAAAQDEGTTTQVVYADWLDENGDADRAEFIRNQAALITMHAHDPNRAATERRGAELLHANYANWIPTVAGVVGIELRAGLVDRVIAVSLEYVEAIRAAFPSARSVRILADVYRLTPNPLAPSELMHLESAMIWLRRRNAGIRMTTQGILNAHACASLLRRLATPR